MAICIVWGPEKVTMSFDFIFSLSVAGRGQERRELEMATLAYQWVFHWHWRHILSELEGMLKMMWFNLMERDVRPKVFLACPKPHTKCAVPTVRRGGITRLFPYFTWTGGHLKKTPLYGTPGILSVASS